MINKHGSKGLYLIKNSFYGGLSQGIPFVIGLLLIPLIISNMGLEQFGLLTLIWAIIGYFSFFDLGLGRAIVKFVAEAVANKNENHARSVFWSSLFLISLVSALGALLFYFSSEYIVYNLLKLDESLREPAVFSLKILSVMVPTVALTACCRAWLEALGEFSRANYLMLLGGVFNFVVPFFVTLVSDSFFYIILYLVVLRVLLTFVYLYLCFSSSVSIGIPVVLSKSEMLSVLNFGGWVTVGQALHPFLLYADRFIIASMLLMTDLAFYTTPYEMLVRTLIIPAAVTRIIFPMLSSTNTDMRASYDLVMKSVKLICIVFVPCLIVLSLFSEELLTIWLGLAFAENSTVVVQLLCLGMFANSIGSVFVTYLQAVSKPKWVVYIMLAEMPFYFIGLYYVTMYFGLVGAAAFWSLRYVFEMFVFLFMSKIEVDRLSRIRLLMVLILSLLILLVCLFVKTILIKVVVMPALLLMVLLSIWTLICNNDEKELIKSFISN